MKFLSAFLSATIVFSYLLFIFSPAVTQAASNCPDKNTPTKYNQQVGQTFTGGNGITYKCVLDANGNAGWVAQPGIVFPIPNITGFTNLSQIINVIISLIFFITGLAFLFNLVIGGIQWLNSGGDPKSLGLAQGRITAAMIGLIIVVAAYAITAIVGAIFGISIVGGFNFKTP